LSSRLRVGQFLTPVHKSSENGTARTAKHTQIFHTRIRIFAAKVRAILVSAFHSKSVVWVLGHATVWHAKRKVSEYALGATTGIVRMSSDDIGRFTEGATNDAKSADIIRNANSNFGWPTHRPST
jgi:hypothetical protein